MQDEHASEPNAAQDPWQVPGAFRAQDPLQPEMPPAGQWEAIEARMQKKRPRPIFWWFLSGVMVLGLGLGAYVAQRPMSGDQAELAASSGKPAAVVDGKEAASTIAQDVKDKSALQQERSEPMKATASEHGNPSPKDVTQRTLPTKKDGGHQRALIAASLENTRGASPAKRAVVAIANRQKLQAKTRETRRPSTAKTSVSEELGTLGQAGFSFAGEKPGERSSAPESAQADVPVLVENPSTGGAPPTGAVADVKPKLQVPSQAVRTDTLPDSTQQEVAKQDSVKPQGAAPNRSDEKPHLPWFMGIGVLTSTDNLALPMPSSVGGARLTTLEPSRGAQLWLGLQLPKLSTSRLQTEVAVLAALVRQRYTLVPARQGETTYQYRESGDTLVAIPNTPAPVEKYSQTLHLGLQPGIRYQLGRKGLAFHGGLGLWGLWQTGSDARPVRLQIQPQAGLSVPLIRGLAVLASVRYQSSVSSQFGALQGDQQRFFYGLGLTWYR